MSSDLTTVLGPELIGSIGGDVRELGTAFLVLEHHDKAGQPRGEPLMPDDLIALEVENTERLETGVAVDVCELG